MEFPSADMRRETHLWDERGAFTPRALASRYSIPCFFSFRYMVLRESPSLFAASAALFPL